MSEEDFDLSEYGQDDDNPRSTVRPNRSIPPDVSRYIGHLCTTKSGIELFRWLMQECGYQHSVVDINAKTGEPIVHRMIANAALQQLWLDLRKNVPRDSLIQIEIPQEEQ